MFDVTLYTFSKRGPSTAVPSAAGTTVSCQAKLPLDIIRPTIQLQLSGAAAANPTSYNYARIQVFGRYYWINSWRNIGPLWEADLSCDVLASWKSEIGNQICYIYRSSYSYNGDIVDTLYPTIARYRRFRISLSSMWDVENPAQGGHFILGIVGNGFTRYYGFTHVQLNTFLASIYSQTYYDAVLTAFGAAEYPEAKVAVNPLQYVASIRYYSCSFGLPNQAAAIHYTGFVNTIPVGPVSVSVDPGTMIFDGSGSNYDDQTSYNHTSYTQTIDTADFVHPQSSQRGDFLQLAPYTSYQAFIPPWGLIQLDPADLVDATDLIQETTIDLRSGTGVLTLSAKYTATNSQIIARSVAKIGVDCPLSAVVQAGVTALSTATTLMGAVAGLATGNLGAVAGSVSSAIGDAVRGQIPHLSVVGSQGSAAELAGSAHLQVVHRYVADDDLSDKGRPLMDIRTISAIPGYIMCDSDHVSISCTLQELNEIRSVMANGFYYE